MLEICHRDFLNREIYNLAMEYPEEITSSSSDTQSTYQVFALLARIFNLDMITLTYLQKQAVFCTKKSRQVTVLPVVAKVCEMLVHMQATEYFEALFHYFVSEYPKIHGCPSAVLMLAEHKKANVINAL